MVVSTFPGLTGTLGRLLNAGKLDTPTLGVVIDSDPHPGWVHSGNDRHVVLNPADIARVQGFGTKEAPVSAGVVRPPVDARHLEPIDQQAARAQFGLPANDRVLLVSGGGWGLALPDD